ncbi:MAG: chemotaxis-specific protein-glutamate methyltransferase CheB [Deltaproteobacteria bacterium]|nr:chemotaxis-specific protein-glutamate methyltransferase CheB [Deltaproteobacteria bacterium]
MKPRVLVVDDSAFARMVLSRVLREGGINVVGVARDGNDALAKIAELDPDVVTLDLTMPELDGLGVLKVLAARPRPRVIVVSMSTIDSEPGAEALALGAIDLISKPTALASERLSEIGDELIAKILATVPRVLPPTLTSVVQPAAASRIGLVMIGTSTGGPQALTRLLAGLPNDLPVPVVIALHIPVEYTASLAARLDKSSPLRVVEAADGVRLMPGMAVIARGGNHLHIEGAPGELRGRVSTTPLRTYMPSVDELFSSGARAVGAGALGVILTGMGDDGLAGARLIAAAGGRLITEAMSTCVVYGMPRCVDEAGIGATSVPLDRIAKEIAGRV